MRFWSGLLLMVAVSSAQDVEALAQQVRGEGCGFDGACQSRSWLNWMVTSKRECVRDAAECLGRMGAGARAATPALIEAVRTGPNNFDTGDGTIHVRDAVVEALGKTGDPRALPVLLEALANPKPMDVDYGAIPRDKPEGEAAALRALGYLGPVAAAAVGRIAPYLEHQERNVVEAAASALGAIGDASAIPALAGALGRGETADRVAAALGRFGPAAKPALPALMRLIEEEPDRYGEMRIRQAIASIGGRGAAEALPKSYPAMLNEVSRLVRETAKGRGLKLRGTHVNSPKEEVAVKLSSGAAVTIGLSREAWVTRRVAEGSVTATPSGGEATSESYMGEDQLARVLDRAVR